MGIRPKMLAFAIRSALYGEYGARSIFIGLLVAPDDRQFKPQ